MVEIEFEPGDIPIFMSKSMKRRMSEGTYPGMYASPGK